jgi:hypothetical protein
MNGWVSVDRSQRSIGQAFRCVVDPVKSIPSASSFTHLLGPVVAQAIDAPGHDLALQEEGQDLRPLAERVGPEDAEERHGFLLVAAGWFCCSLCVTLLGFVCVLRYDPGSIHQSIDLFYQYSHIHLLAAAADRCAPSRMRRLGGLSFERAMGWIVFSAAQQHSSNGLLELKKKATDPAAQTATHTHTHTTTGAPILPPARLPCPKANRYLLTTDHHAPLPLHPPPHTHTHPQARKKAGQQQSTHNSSNGKRGRRRSPARRRYYNYC